MAAKTKNASGKKNADLALLQRWGGVGALVLAVSMIAANWVYLTGNLNEPGGVLAYDLADFLAGPLWAASLVTMVLALRERIGELAGRRMNLALMTALLAAAAMLSVALIRSANRHYHLEHPELQLQASSVMVAWTTLVAGVNAAALHLFGWTSLLVGWAGRASRRMPSGLSLLYLLVGAAGLFVYLRPELEGAALLLGAVALLWQGMLLLRPE